MGHLIFLVPELEWDKRLEPTGFILKVTQEGQVMNTMRKGFDMTIQDCRIAPLSQLVPHLVNIQPLYKSIRHFEVFVNPLCNLLLLF